LPKFKTTQEIVKIIQNKDQIRNFGVIAHVDHGKCVSGNSLVTFSDGRIEEIAKVYDSLRIQGPIALEADSFNPQTLKMEDKRISYVWKLHSETLVEVTLRNGYSVETTPEHPFYTLGADGIVRQKKAEAIETGDFVLVPNVLKSKPADLDDIKSKILTELGSHGYYQAYLDAQLSRSINDIVRKGGIRRIYSQLNTPSSFFAFRSSLTRGSLRVDDLLRLSDYLGIPKQDVYDHIVWIAYRARRKKPGGLSCRIKIPKTHEEFEDLAYLLGLLWGNGSDRAGFDNCNKAVLDEASGIIQNQFDADAILVRDKGRSTFGPDGHGGLSLVRFLEDVFQYPSKGKRTNLVFPEIILRMDNDCLAAFLRGEFDADGGIGRSSAVVSVTAASEKFARQLSIALLRFSIIPTIRRKGKYFTVCISGENIVRFKEKIGFNVSAKRRALDEIAIRAVNTGKTEIVPINTEILKESGERLDVSPSYMESRVPFYRNDELRKQSLTRRRGLDKILRAFQEISSLQTTIEDYDATLGEWSKLLQAEVRPVEVTRVNWRNGSFDVYDITVPENHTFVANGIVVHNTTMSDSLLAATGLLSPSVAGQALALDYMDLEQQRQMTIKAANVTLYYEQEGKPYVINMIDTPGHIDFTGRVTRSLRAIDGAVVVTDSVEGVMTQTETVTRQALEERVRPVLYINKIDRLVKELRLNPEQMQKWLADIINNFNQLISVYAEPEYKEKWKVSIQDSTVSFGSAKDRWGFNADIAKKKGLRFKDVYDAYTTGKPEDLAERAPLHEAVLGMVTRHHPPPHVAQGYRIPKIWHGNIDSEVGQSMLKCDDNGPTVMMCTNVVVDPQAGIVATGRLFSGTVRDGDEVYLLGAKREERIQSVNMYMGATREILNVLTAGNIPALLGLEHARAGETLSSIKDLVPFESIRYVSEPVVTIAIEAKHPRDLPKLVEALRRLSIEDPNLVVRMNEESGETTLSGMGVLHLEIATTMLQQQKLEIVTSQPLVNYREAIRTKAGPIMAKSPNRHNKIFMRVEPLTEEIIQMIRTGQISENIDKKTLAKILRDKGWQADEAKSVVAIDERGNLLLEETKGVQFLQESMDSIRAGFIDVMINGPLAYEYCRGVKVILDHYVPHEDPAHRTYAQLMPASRRAILGAMLSAEPTLLEPILGIEVKCPSELIGAVAGVISSKRGKMLNVQQKEVLTIIEGEVPTSETFDLSEAMRGATAGKAIWNTHFKSWSPVPASLLMPLVTEIRKRKGLSPEPPKAEEFIDKE
jgi:elongation factor 2